jgi:class 3 adenylate cyclase/YHS domain-containing protein
MELELAILMADLSGYTALTETHGAVSAADLIDKYIRIAEKCLVGNTTIHERTGDEIMFISDSADDLLKTALLLEVQTSREEHFLLIHGGLHHGKLLKRGGNYFGAALNFVSRIAARASAGSFACSDDFIKALKNPSIGSFTSTGVHSLKNIQVEKEIFALNIPGKYKHFIDPVCRMLIVNPQQAIHHPTEAGIFFCSSTCLHHYQVKNKQIANLV